MELVTMQNRTYLGEYEEKTQTLSYAVEINAESGLSQRGAFKHVTEKALGKATTLTLANANNHVRRRLTAAEIATYGYVLALFEENVKIAAASVAAGLTEKALFQ